jgi:hypothetical protein
MLICETWVVHEELLLDGLKLGNVILFIRRWGGYILCASKLGSPTAGDTGYEGGKGGG